VNESQMNESYLRILYVCPILGIAFSPMTSVSSECKNAKLKAWNDENLIAALELLIAWL